MRLQEIFLIESSEEDRAIISLSASIISKLKAYENDKKGPEDFNSDSDFDDVDVPDDAYEDPLEDEPIEVGTIGELFDTPLEILNSVKLIVQSDYGIKNKNREERGAESIGPEDEALGYWLQAGNLILINKDHLGLPKMKSIVAHELRHALDDYKSNNKANQSKRYAAKKHKDSNMDPNNPDYDTADYWSRPNEMNARFLQVLNNMVPIIKREVNKPNSNPEKLKTILFKNLKGQLENNLLGSNMFPEKEKTQAYRRFLKRGIDFIQKEIAHQSQIN